MLTDTWTNVKCIYVPYAYNSYMALEPNHIYKLHTTNKATVDLKKIKSQSKSWELCFISGNF